MNTAENTLSNTPGEMITISKAEYEMIMAELTKHREMVIVFQEQNESLKHHIAVLIKMLQGPKSERFIAGDNKEQILLDLDIEAVTPAEQPTETITYTRKKGSDESKPGHGRATFPPELPRVDKIIEPDEDISGCKYIGEEVTEILALSRGKYYVKRLIRRKYAKVEDNGVIIGKLPMLPIYKGNADFTLLAAIIIARFVDHLPWYRQSQMMKRNGVIISESTMIGWFRAVCELLEILYELHKSRFLSSTYIQADETALRVLSRDKPGATHQGYLWVYNDPISGNVIFEYCNSRARKWPEDFLKNYQGALQTDGYTGYDTFVRNKAIRSLACWAHVRRKFVESLQNDKELAENMLCMIQGLYKIERDMPLESDFDTIKKLRQEKSIPQLKKIEEWLQNNLTSNTPKSLIRQAIAYTMNLWPRLTAYVEDGRYQIDNNLIENKIRPVAIGRKNYLFAGSHEAAQRGAMIYSFMGTCKQLGINPQDWLENVLERIPYFKRSDDYSVLLPASFKKS